MVNKSLSWLNTITRSKPSWMNISHVFTKGSLLRDLWTKKEGTFYYFTAQKMSLTGGWYQRQHRDRQTTDGILNRKVHNIRDGSCINLLLPLNSQSCLIYGSQTGKDIVTKIYDFSTDLAQLQMDFCARQRRISCKYMWSLIKVGSFKD